MALITINRIVVEQPPGSPAPRRRFRRPIAIGAALLATAGLSVGLTVASANPSPQVSTTSVTFIAVSPAYKLLTNKALAANAIASEVVIGGKTTVPSNATTVEINVTASGTVAGYMNFNPTGNLGGGSGQYLSWSAGGSDTGTIEENVGKSDELNFANGNGAAKVTATIIGYSTQVTDGDISGLDGTAGQVLANTGTGASWQTMGQGYGTGNTGDALSVSTTYGPIDSLTLPAGSYEISWNATAYNSVSDQIICVLLAPSNAEITQANATVDAATPIEALSDQGLVTTTGGTVSEGCRDTSNGAYVYFDRLTAVQVNAASGLVFSGLPGSAHPAQGVAIP